MKNYCWIMVIAAGLLRTDSVRGKELAGADQDRLPNIVFIMADDLGWKDVGYAGAEFFETPHIDQLAENGMQFSNAYSGGPNCSPTRACLMTGTYTPRHQIYTPGGLSKGNISYMRLLVPARNQQDPALQALAAEQFVIRNDLDPAFVCVPEILSQAGYQTARLGKWHLGPDTQGFDVSSANGRGGPDGSFYGNIDVAEQLTDRALEFIEANQDGPFFLYLSHWDVHTPHRARREVVERFREKKQAMNFENPEMYSPVYAAMIDAVDSSVGRVVSKIEELGLEEDTLIVFTSDNGGLPRVSQLSPLRGQKGSLFEAGVRIAACMRWDGVIAPGATCAEPITSVDYLPTFAALANASLPSEQPVDGVSLVPLLRGESIEERAIFWHYPLYLQGVGLTIELPDGGGYSWRGFPSTSIRKGDWKLIEFHEDDHVELYNLVDDPAEQNDLANSMSELARRLRAELDEWQSETDAPVPTIANPNCVLLPK